MKLSTLLEVRRRVPSKPKAPKWDTKTDALYELNHIDDEHHNAYISCSANSVFSIDVSNPDQLPGIYAIPLSRFLENRDAHVFDKEADHEEDAIVHPNPHMNLPYLHVFDIDPTVNRYEIIHRPILPGRVEALRKALKLYHISVDDVFDPEFEERGISFHGDSVWKDMVNAIKTKTAKPFILLYKILKAADYDAVYDGGFKFLTDAPGPIVCFFDKHKLTRIATLHNNMYDQPIRDVEGWINNIKHPTFENIQRMMGIIHNFTDNYDESHEERVRSAVLQAVIRWLQGDPGEYTLENIRSIGGFFDIKVGNPLWIALEPKFLKYPVFAFRFGASNRLRLPRKIEKHLLGLMKSNMKKQEVIDAYKLYCKTLGIKDETE